MKNLETNLDILVRLTKVIAVSAIRDFDFKTQVKILSDVGLQPIEIASMLGKTPNHVRVALHELRKRR